MLTHFVFTGFFAVNCCPREERGIESTPLPSRGRAASKPEVIVLIISVLNSVVPGRDSRSLLCTE